jgi:hypothetical protein
VTAPTGTEATTARIAEVLAEHEPNGFSCACGWRNETATYATAHRAHVAALLSAGVIRDMQAAAHGMRFRVEVACDGYSFLMDEDVPSHITDTAAYQDGAHDAAEAIRSVLEEGA